MQIGPISSKFAKVSLKFNQILVKAFNNVQRLLELCQSGEISTNLVTLMPWLTEVLILALPIFKMAKTYHWQEEQ